MPQNSRQSFTLVELIIVIVIIGVLALIAVPRIYINIENARRAEALAVMRSIAEAEKAYAAALTGNEIKTVSGSADWPVTSDFENDGQNEYSMEDPVSQNFDFLITGADLRVGYIKAIRKRTTRNSYCRCLSSSNFTESASNDCTTSSCP